MIYQEIGPPTDLAHHLACFWHFALDSSDPESMEHTIPPDGTVSLAWVQRMEFLVVVGPRTSALRVPVMRGVHYFGARFRPGASGSVLGVSAHLIRDQRIPLSAPHPAQGLPPDAARCLPPDQLSQLLTALRAAEPEFESTISAMISVLRGWPLPQPDPVVAQLVDRIVQECESEVQDLISDLGLSYRQVLRRFKEAVGLTPKEFLRLRRVRNACVRAVEASGGFRWAAISADSGFADQAHLSREFGRAFGWPPSLVAAYLRQIEHSGVRP